MDENEHEKHMSPLESLSGETCIIIQLVNQIAAWFQWKTCKDCTEYNFNKIFEKRLGFLDLKRRDLLQKGKAKRCHCRFVEQRR